MKQTNSPTVRSREVYIEEYNKKLNQKVKDGLVTPEDVSKYINLIRNDGVVDRVFVSPVIYVVSDPSDNVYFMSANCLNADYLITGNTTDFDIIKPDIVKLQKKLKIVSPSEFLKRPRTILNGSQKHTELGVTRDV